MAFSSFVFLLECPLLCLLNRNFLNLVCLLHVPEIPIVFSELLSLIVSLCPGVIYMFTHELFEFANEVAFMPVMLLCIFTVISKADRCDDAA